MSRTGLPYRPFADLAPPPDGLTEVRREALRRRRRRLAGTLAGGAGAAVAAAVAVLVTAGTGDLAVLRPVTPGLQPGDIRAPHASAPAAPAYRTGQLAPGVDGGAAGAGSARHTGVGSPSAGRSGHRTSASPGGSGAGAQYASGSTGGTPITLRRYRSTNTADRVPQAATLCSESAYSGGGTDIHTEFGWCLAAVATRVSGGEQLTLNMCRDHTGPGTLSFTSSREVDLAVLRGGKTLWHWAAAHPGHRDDHALSAPRDGCWNWSLVWPDIRQDGRSAGSGAFTLVATTTSTQMQAEPTTSATFRY